MCDSRGVCGHGSCVHFCCLLLVHVFDLPVRNRGFGFVLKFSAEFYTRNCAISDVLYALNSYMFTFSVQSVDLAIQLYRCTCRFYVQRYMCCFRDRVPSEIAFLTYNCI